MGFGYERDDHGVPIHIPQLGGIIIGNNVEIGSMSVIARGTINPTIIEDNVKIDDHVFIAHNCHIKSGTFVIGSSEVSGSVVIGNNSWIGPNSSIINGVKIGDNCTVGIGAVVTKDIYDNAIVAGNPAINIDDLKIIRNIYKELIKKWNNQR